jgi:hypothetical protein
LQGTAVGIVLQVVWDTADRAALIAPTFCQLPTKLEQRKGQSNWPFLVAVLPSLMAVAAIASLVPIAPFNPIPEDGFVFIFMVELPSAGFALLLRRLQFTLLRRLEFVLSLNTVLLDELSLVFIKTTRGLVVAFALNAVLAFAVAVIARRLSILRFSCIAHVASVRGLRR